jgi:hypothetical protein
MTTEAASDDRIGEVANSGTTFSVNESICHERDRDGD